MEDRVSLVLADCGRTAASPQRMVWELATRLPRSRFHLRVWLSAAAGMDEFAHALEARAILVERIRDADSHWNWRGRFDVRHRFIRARPALLHLHHASALVDRLAALLVDSAGSARVVLTHAVPGPATQRAPLRRALGRTDAITASSGVAADSLVRELGVERCRIRVIPEGTDAPDEHAERPVAVELRERLGASPLRPLWVCPARLDPERGHVTLLEALAELHGRGVPFTVALAGEGSLRETLERRAAELGLGARLHFLGAFGDLGPLLLAADTVVLPSPGDGVPRVLLEALARGRPVIAGGTGGVLEVIDDGVDGRAVPPGDARALANALEALYRRPDAARRMGAQGALRVREEFSWTRVAEAFEEVYDEVLGLASFVPERGRAAYDAR
jgi:glycosyltransferase involved in cell wall biosynthesis